MGHYCGLKGYNVNNIRCVKVFRHTEGVENELKR